MQKQAKEPHLPKRRDKRRYDKIKVSRPTYDYILNEINIFYILFFPFKNMHMYSRTGNCVLLLFTKTISWHNFWLILRGRVIQGSQSKMETMYKQSRSALWAQHVLNVMSQPCLSKCTCKNTLPVPSDSQPQICMLMNRYPNSLHSHHFLIRICGAFLHLCFYRHVRCTPSRNCHETVPAQVAKFRSSKVRNWTRLLASSSTFQEPQHLWDPLDSSALDWGSQVEA